MEPDAAELRVAASLVEKQRTTPDQYPLTLNSLRLACNQSTNRDPVVDYDEGTIRSALDRLTRRKWVTLASWSTARSVKYKHLLDQALGLDNPQLAVMTVLMLRGAQTPGELRQRTERIHRFDSNEELERTLEELVERGLCTLLQRRLRATAWRIAWRRWRARSPRCAVSSRACAKSSVHEPFAAPHPCPRALGGLAGDGALARGDLRSA